MKTARKPKVVGIGELLWDVLPTGARMGGAPANFACHAQALGANASVVSRVGDDDPGHQLVRNLRELGLSAAGIGVDPVHPTGTVEVKLGDDGQPHFTISRGVAWDHLVADSHTVEMMKTADAICFGSLGQRSSTSRSAIRRLVTATPQDAFRIFDVNLRQDYFTAELIHESLGMANVCKLSDSELPVIAELLGIDGDIDTQIARMIGIYQLRVLVYTRGSGGSIVSDGKNRYEHPGFPTDVRDTVGAGDSFTATVAMGLLHGWPVDAISETANAVASHVCSCEGAIPPMPEHLRKRFLRDADVTEKSPIMTSAHPQDLEQTIR